MRYIKFLVILIIVVVGISIAYAYSGLYNPAATEDHNAVTAWYLHTIMERGVETRAEGVDVPDLSSPDLVREGAEHYAEMCAGCHLAPGQTSSEIREGLNPKPPALPRIAKYLEPKEIFWVVKHGVRMTGMPAWGVTHSDQKLWAVTAFVRKLDGMSPERYQELTHASGMHDQSQNADHDMDQPMDSDQPSQTPPAGGSR